MGGGAFAACEVAWAHHAARPSGAMLRPDPPMWLNVPAAGLFQHQISGPRLTSLLRFISRCSPATAKPAGNARLHELKLDRCRLQIIKHRRQVRIFAGRRGAEWTEPLAAFAEGA